MPADENVARHDETNEAQRRFESVADALRTSARAEGVPGASVAVLSDGQLRVAHYGNDGLPDSRPRGDASRHHISCLTKAIIAYVCLMLVDQGLVGLDEPLADKLPEAVRRRGGQTVDITLRHLLAHTSGIDDAREIFIENDSSDLAAYVARFADYQQLAEPGEVFSYSECATAIAALLIERMLGTPWRRAVNTMLLEPLGITPVPERRDFATHYGSSVSRGHEWNTSVEQFVALSLDQQIMSDTSLGANSFCFTIKEIVSLARLGLNDGASPDGKRLLSAELAREMRSFQIDVPGHHLVDSWGLGWLHFDDHSYGFEAAGAGHQGFVQIFPEEKEILVVLGNVFPSLVIYFDVLRAFNDGPHKNSAQKSAIDEKLCIGSYSTDGNRLVVEEGKRRLEYRYFRRLSQEEWRETDYGELVPSSIGAFNPKSAKGIRRSTFTPIWSGGGSDPRFFRVGLLILRRDEEPAGDVGVGESTATA